MYLQKIVIKLCISIHNSRSEALRVLDFSGFDEIELWIRLVAEFWKLSKFFPVHLC
jgi:hypothetical protein